MVMLIITAQAQPTLRAVYKRPLSYPVSRFGLVKQKTPQRLTLLPTVLVMRLVLAAIAVQPGRPFLA